MTATTSLHSHPLSGSPNTPLPAVMWDSPFLFSHIDTSPSHCSPLFFLRRSWLKEVLTPDISHWAEQPGNSSSSLLPTTYPKRKPLWNSEIKFSLLSTLHVQSAGTCDFRDMWLYSGTGSDPQKRLVLDLRLHCCHLEILNNCAQRVLHFRFSLWLAVL